MKCPICGSWTEIIHTTMRKDNTRRRRYVCGNEHRFTTIESVQKITSVVIRLSKPTTAQPKGEPNGL